MIFKLFRSSQASKTDQLRHVITLSSYQCAIPQQYYIVNRSPNFLTDADDLARSFIPTWVPNINCVQ